MGRYNGIVHMKILLTCFQCFILNSFFKIKAVVVEDGVTSIVLNDTHAWVQAQVTTTLQGHINDGSFEVGHVVEVVKSLGDPHDLHIVSVICGLHK